MKYIFMLSLFTISALSYGFDYQGELNGIGNLIVENENKGQRFIDDKRLLITYEEFSTLFKELDSIMPESEKSMSDDKKKSAIEYIKRSLSTTYDMAIATINRDLGIEDETLKGISYIGSTHKVNENKALGNAALEVSIKMVFQKESSLIILRLVAARLDDKVYIVRIGQVTSVK